MSAPLEPIEAGADPPRHVPGLLSCLVKGPLGCLFFALGALAVLVLLLPPALGRVLDRALEEWFAEHFAGHLELGDAWLGSFYDSQRIERLILRDPSGDEILRGAFKAPSLAEAVEDPSDRFGPLELRIDLLHLVEAGDGTTNLERALEELPREAEDSGEDGARTDMTFQFKLKVSVARLRITSASGKTSELSNLDFHGTFEWGPEETRFELEGGSDPDLDEPLQLRAELSRPEFGRRRPWQGKLVLDGSPTALARTLCPPARPFAPLAGPRIDELNWSKDGNEVALLFEDEGARFELIGQEVDGLVAGQKGGVLTAVLPCSNEPGRALLATLLPLVASLECLDPARSHELRLVDYRWPLDGDWSRLSGDLELALAPVRCAFVPLPFGVPGELLPSEERTLRMRLRDGVLACEQLDYTLDQGWLRVEGTLDLDGGDALLSVAGEYGDEQLESVRLVGTHDRLVPELPEAPLPPVIPADGLPPRHEKDG